MIVALAITRMRNLVSIVMLVLVFFIPTHLLENPLRHARGIRPDEWRS